MVLGGGYQTFFDQLVEFASAGTFAHEVKTARDDYFSETGEVREDEPSFEARMEAFTEWYVLDRVLPDRNQTPLELFLAERRDALGAEELEVYRGLRDSYRSLFEFHKARKEHLIVRDLSSMRKLPIFERRQPYGLEKGAIFDARVVSFHGNDIFTRGIIHHPREARKVILEEAKRSQDLPREEFARLRRRLSFARLRCDHYRRVDVSRLYRQILTSSDQQP
jgi:hypothetical protein